MAVPKNLREVREGMDANIRQYYEAAGNFITMFAAVESAMHQVLWQVADVKPSIAPAIFSGTRVDAASKHVKRIGEAVGWPEEKTARFDELCHQLGEITQTRNDLLHFGVRFKGATDGYTISNAMLAHTEERIRETKISATILDNMTYDLIIIFIQLLKFPLGALSRVDRSEPMSPPALKSAWRYKPERRSGRPTPPDELSSP